MEKVNLTAPQWQLAAWSEYSPVGGGNGGPPRGMIAVKLEGELGVVLFTLEFSVRMFRWYAK